MKFFNVFDPLGVQQDIYRRKEQRERVKAEGAARARHEEYAQYFGTFYEILEEERKKKIRAGKVAAPPESKSQTDAVSQTASVF